MSWLKVIAIAAWFGWAIYNVTVAFICDGTVSPGYWPPVTQCYPK